MGGNPTGISREPRRDYYHFIHNVYANFFKDTLDYFAIHLVPDSEYRMVATYDKAVAAIIQECDLGREMDKPNLPAIILNPSGDFTTAESISGGKQLWRFPNLAPGMIKRIFDPVYKDDNLQIHVGFMRITGEMEILMLLNSFYEFCDIKMLLLQVFGGLERWIYPDYFTTFIILPEELINYQYTNSATGVSYDLDWEANGAFNKLVKTTNRNELVIPCNIKPIYKLTGMSDSSNRYGGADDIAEWKLGVTITYELEMPTYLVLETDYKVASIKTSITSGSTYSSYADYEPPKTILQKEHLTPTDSTSLIESCTNLQDYLFHTRYFHTVTQSEIDSTSNLVITIPEQIDDLNTLVVNSKYGEMLLGDHYSIEDSGTNLVIDRDNVELEVDMVIELYIYISV